MTALTKSTYFIGLITLIFSALTPVAIALSEPPAQASPEALSLLVLKMTGEEYVLIINNSPADISDLSRFSLKAFNNYNPLTINASVTTQTLPAVGLAQGEMLMLSSTIRPTCGASLAGKLSVSLVDGSGRLEIIQTSTTGTNSAPEVVDAVNWSSGSSSEIKSVPANSKAPLAVYYRMQLNDSYSWQLAELDSIKPCQLNVTMPGSTVAGQVIVTSDDTIMPQEVTVEAVTGEGAITVEDQTVDLLPVQITELLPNPLGLGNDSTDEYIELYNPNESDFDLSSFQLQTGISKLYNFSFNTGTTLPAKTYTAFTSSTTGLTLSNTLSQARLLSPAGEAISATELYRSAKDGQSWSLIEGVWKWSEATTPSHPNVLVAPKLVKKIAPTTNNSTKKTAREPTAKKPKPAKAPKTAKPAKPKKIKAEKTTKYSTGPNEETLMERPIQTKLVAAVGSVALLYGAYEYRSSLANGLYKFRRKLGFGGPNRG